MTIKKDPLTNIGFGLVLGDESFFIILVIFLIFEDYYLEVSSSYSIILLSNIENTEKLFCETKRIFQEPCDIAKSLDNSVYSRVFINEEYVFSTAINVAPKSENICLIKSKTFS